MARKPLVGTVAANVLEHGTGAVNVDGCRIATDDDLNGGAYSDERRASESEWVKNGGTIHSSTGEAFVQPSGRWPANVLLDDDAAALLDEQTGELVSGANPTRRGSDKFRDAYGDFKGQEECVPARGVDRGGASRFFYVAKASTRERNAGLDGFAERESPKQGGAPIGRATSIEKRGGNITARNVHPTVKPIELMRWLVRLVTPAGGLVLDPFTGSGTTGCACVLEGFEFVGVEREPEYAAIAEARIAYWTPTQGVLL
jgi:site-specific DNA-methyltransferase (adenine-specific)